MCGMCVCVCVTKLYFECFSSLLQTCCAELLIEFSISPRKSLFAFETNLEYVSNKFVSVVMQKKHQHH